MLSQEIRGCDMGKQIALVTGGSRGIGSAIVQKLVLDGYFVYFTYNQNVEKAKAQEEELNKFEKQVRAIKVTFCVAEEYENLFEIIKNESGRLDFLVNNAGIINDMLFAKMKPCDWESVININLNSVFSITRVCLDLMLPLKKASIVNITSVSGIRGAVGQCNYSAAKAGIIAFTKSLARELSNFGVRVNAVAPGFIETDMTNAISGVDKKRVLQTCLLKRFGTPSEIANVVSFLGSDNASYIQGQVIVVDGGVLL